VGQWGSGHEDHWKARPLTFDLLEDERIHPRPAY
jgi:hypothetical protein